MRTAKAIEIIHDAARTAPQGILDHQVFLDRDLMLTELVDFSRSSHKCIDVPLRKIVALGRDDFWTRGESWRQVTYHIHGDGWSNNVFDYFSEEWRDKSFPVPCSLYDLKLEAMGGVCKCANGNHRLVAAKTWLVATHGEHAAIRKANLQHYPIYDALIPESPRLY